MFKFLKRSGQAKRKAPSQPAARLQWRKSWNWLLLAFPLGLGAHYLYQAEQWLPIRTIQLSGSFEYMDQGEIEKSLRPYIGQGFFSLNIHELQQTLYAKPWTDSVSVRRIWPDKLRVTIREKKPVARWDGRHLLSDSGRVFRAAGDAFAHLPLVFADNHPPRDALRRFYQIEARFAAVDEKLVAMRIDSRGAIDLELIGGLQVKLGRDDVEHKIERLVSIYPRQILPRRERIRRLDLRYSNGFAVAWKPEVLQGSDKASIWSNSNV